MAVGHGLLAGGGPEGKAAAVALRATADGEQLVSSKEGPTDAEESRLLLRAILVELRVLNALMFPGADLDNERNAFTDTEDLIRR